MTSITGNIANFDCKNGEWTIFLGRLNQLFKVNAIEDAKKSGILLNLLTDESYRLLRNLAFPRDLEALPYANLVQCMSDHFKKKQGSFADRAKFYGATKTPDETLNDWAARLRGLASHCEFGAVLETVLRDRFVLGLESGPERDKLFQRDAQTLTLARALEIAEQTASARKAIETASGGSSSGVFKEEPIYRMFTGESSRHSGAGAGGGAGRVGAGRGGGGGGSSNAWGQAYNRDGAAMSVPPRCPVCGLKSHSAAKCRFKNYTCQNCGQKGHLQKVCKVGVYKINAEEEIDVADGGENCEKRFYLW